MSAPDHRRRFLCLALAGAISLPLAFAARADDVVNLTWRDLVPDGEQVLVPDLQALLPHDESAMAAGQPPSSGMRTDWNSRTVRLSGFVIPLDYDGNGVTAFILVPYVGACIHVPPPPANQLVLVTTAQPYENDSLFSSVTVTGLFSSATTTTQLAEIGYALSAERIDVFQG